jgi:hypothetical protein
MGKKAERIDQFWMAWHARHGGATGAVPGRAAPSGRPGAPRLADLVASARTAGSQVVAGTATMLFDAARARLRLRPGARRVLEAAAHLASLGGAVEAEGPWPRARRLLAGRMPAGLRRRDYALLLAILPGRDDEPAASARAADPVAREAHILRLLLNLANAIGDARHQARLESVRLQRDHAALRLGGLAAWEAADRIEALAGAWAELGGGELRVTIAPPSANELTQTASAPLDSDTLLPAAMQRGLAGALVAWQAAMIEALIGTPEALAQAEQATTWLRELVAAFRPALKRKPVRAARQALAQVLRLLRPVVERQAATQAARAYQAGLTPEAAEEFQPLVEALDQGARQAGAALAAWLDSAEAVETAEHLLAFGAAVPARRPAYRRLAEGAPELVEAAAATLGRRLAANTGHDRPHARRVHDGAVRCLAVLNTLAAPPSAAPPAAGQIELLQQRLGALLQLGATDDLIAQFLDQWAVRQARRKAPQLHGVAAVLAFRQGIQAARAAARRAAADAARPLRGGRLQRQMRQPRV